MVKTRTHEAFGRKNKVRLGSDRSFGVVFAMVFAIIGLLPLWRDGDVRFWSLIVAGVFLTAALTYPSVLNPINRLWFRLGLLLHKIVNPIILALLFWYCQTNLNRPASGAGLRCSGRQPTSLGQGGATVLSEMCRGDCGDSSG